MTEGLLWLALVFVCSTGAGIFIGRAIALSNERRPKPLTYEQRKALIERSRRRHPAGKCPNHVPGEWVA